MVTVRRGRKLSTQILGAQLSILLAALIAGFAMYAGAARSQLDRQYEQRALAVASSVASLDAVRDALGHGDPAHTLQPLAEGVRGQTKTSFVVVADRNGIRYSHPNPDLIGKQVSTSADPVLSGRPWVGVQTGTLGRSARGKAPVFGRDGSVIGEVSVGILETQVSAEVLRALPNLLLYSGAALAIGVATSLLLSRRLRRQTFGLELHEIVDLLQEREAMLHGLREGVITLDPSGRVSLVNDEARRLLDLRPGSLGERIDALLPAGRLRDLLTGDSEVSADEAVLTDTRCLTVTRTPVTLQGRPLGAVVTLSDHTQLVGLLRELDSVRSFTDALRAQQHEHANRMHTVAGLLELGKHDDAAAYLDDISGAASALAESLNERIADPTVVALLLAKVTIAAERGVVLEISPESVLDTAGLDGRLLLTVLGNLIDNAIDAVAGAPEATVTVSFTEPVRCLVQVEVADSGPGVPVGAADVFADGFSTKAPRMGIHRGLGLALVHRLVTQAGGRVDVSNDGGAVFRVQLPARRSAAAEREPAW